MGGIKKDKAGSRRDKLAKQSKGDDHSHAYHGHKAKGGGKEGVEREW